jgi:hypothetical protein
VPSETVAQRERILHTVRRDDGLIDHLRFDLKVLVRAEQSVINKVTVITRDVGCRPDRVQNPQIGFRREAEDLLVLLGPDRRRAQRYRGSRGGTPHDLSATDALHR